MSKVATAIAICLTAAAVSVGSVSPVPAQDTSAASRPHPATTSSATPYYIEFRVATIGTYGHSYVKYGRLGANGQPADARYTDLHPRGNYALMAIGHVLPVPANTQWDPEVLTLPVASSYRRKITAAQYGKLLAAIKRSKAEKDRYWNAVSNNCNHYVGELARAIGLKTPGTFQVSYAFIPALRDLNEPAGSPARAQDERTPTQ
jgi:hypothetical protein